MFPGIIGRYNMVALWIGNKVLLVCMHDFPRYNERIGRSALSNDNSEKIGVRGYSPILRLMINGVAFGGSIVV